MNARSSNLIWFDSDSNALSEIDDAILSISASYSMDMCAQLTVQIHDPNFELAKSNYFSPTRSVIYQSFAIADFGASETQTSGDVAINKIKQFFEIAVAEVSNGPASSPVWTVELRTKAIQQMKRDREPGTIKGANADYARQAADKFGLKYFMENTSKNRQITKASSKNKADSTWDVLSRLAQEAKFVVFETNGTLVFCSQKFLLGKWGTEKQTFSTDSPIVGQDYVKKIETKEYNYIPVNWPSKETDLIKLMAIPSMRMSENDPLESTGSITIDRAAGTSLRPGMTVLLTGVPMFEKLYLVSSVSYGHFGTDPVQVELRTPEREEKDVRDYVLGEIPDGSIVVFNDQA